MLAVWMTRAQEIHELLEYHEAEIERLRKELEEEEYEEIEDGISE